MTVRYEICVRIGEHRYRLAASGEADDIRQAMDIVRDQVPHATPAHAEAFGCIYLAPRGQALRLARPARQTAGGGI